MLSLCDLWADRIRDVSHVIKVTKTPYLGGVRSSVALDVCVRIWYAD